MQHEREGIVFLLLFKCWHTQVPKCSLQGLWLAFVLGFVLMWWLNRSLAHEQDGVLKKEKKGLQELVCLLICFVSIAVQKMHRPINRTTDTTKSHTHTRTLTLLQTRKHTANFPPTHLTQVFYWQSMCHFWEGCVGALTGNRGDLTPNRPNHHNAPKPTCVFVFKPPD